MVVKHQDKISNLNSRLKPAIDNLNEQEYNVSNYATVCVFVSIDLVNSTSFKIQYEDLWRTVIPAFYDTVQQAFGVEKYREDGTEISDFVYLWKFVGDEVLLYIPIFDAKSVEQIINVTNDVVTTIPKRISEYIGDGLSAEYRHGIECDLGAKGVVWIGICNKGTKTNGRNMEYENKYSVSSYSSREKHMSVDFLGSDIDEGFRLAKFATKRRTIISPLLAGVINELHEKKSGSIQSQYVITSYQTLKGVWKNRKVPIVVYFPEGVQDSFDYDELEYDTFCPGIRSDFKGYTANENNNIEKIDQVLKNVGLDTEKDTIIQKLKDERYVQQGATMRRKLPPSREIHLSCACVAKGKKIGIIKDDRGRYCFGGGSIYNETNWIDAAKAIYKNKYNVAISLKANPQPLSVYSGVNKKNGVEQMGIVLMAEVENADGCRLEFKTQKQVKNLTGAKVPDFDLVVEQIYSCLI